MRPMAVYRRGMLYWDALDWVTVIVTVGIILLVLTSSRWRGR